MADGSAEMYYVSLNFYQRSHGPHSVVLFGPDESTVSPSQTETSHMSIRTMCYICFVLQITRFISSSSSHYEYRSLTQIITINSSQFTSI